MQVEWITNGDAWANSYIVGNILVDAGVLPMAVAPYKEQIDTIVLTHCHFDHTARVKEIAHMCKAKVAIHKNDARGLVDDAQSLVHALWCPLSRDRCRTSCLQRVIRSAILSSSTPRATRRDASACSARRTSCSISGDTVFADGCFGRYDFPAGAGRNSHGRSNGSRRSMSKGSSPATGSPRKRTGAGTSRLHSD
ncbi:MAG: MBL fold metallo-hydrolase [Desulfobacterales bacterium]|nr:MBL fold metallo-hydrolase [Desulfobacterales bacterium]